MEYKIIINEEEYKIPNIIYIFNEELFKQYTQEKDDELYLNIEKMKEEEKYIELKRIVDQTCNAVGTYSLEDEEEMKEMCALGPKMRLLDNMAQINYTKGKYELACKKLLELLELCLKFYKKQIEKEIQDISEKKIR